MLWFVEFTLGRAVSGRNIWRRQRLKIIAQEPVGFTRRGGIYPIAPEAVGFCREAATDHSPGL